MKNLITKEEKDRIDSICRQYEIENYTITSDGSIDVSDYVSFPWVDLTEFPLKFNKISGDLLCGFNQLTSLEGSARIVMGDFSCSDNRLHSLENGPRNVSGDYDCSNNWISTLVGGPEWVGGDFFCLNIELTSTYSGDTDIHVGGIIKIDNCHKLPKLVQDNIILIVEILKYQRHFMIWNDDLSLNEENFLNLVADINDGLK